MSKENDITISFDKTHGITMRISKEFKDRKRLKRLACLELAKALFENSAYRWDHEPGLSHSDIIYKFWLLTTDKSVNFKKLGDT